MAVALSPHLPADAIEHLIVADIAPSSASAISSEFQSYIEAMNKIEKSKVSSRREAQDILTRYEPVSFRYGLHFVSIIMPRTLGPNDGRVPLDQP
jgi:hypothetical protein